MTRLLVGLVTLLAVGCSGPAATPTPTPNPPHTGTTEGCPSTYWQQPEHFDEWEEYQPGHVVGTFYKVSGPLAGMTLAEVLEQPAETVDEDPVRTLLREAVTALLNAAHEELEYPYSRYTGGAEGRPPLVETVDGVLAQGDTGQIQDFAAELAEVNGLGCPLR
jgi:hypothetical protein